MEKYPITARSLERFFHVKEDEFERQYKEHLSGFRQWSELCHADKWLVFPDNIGPYLCIDETSISMGALYTIITNRGKHGKKGSIVAIVEGTKSEDVIKVLKMIAEEKRKEVLEVTLDLSESMNMIVRAAFPNATLVIDRFHVQQLAFEAMQEIRIKHRREAIQKETNAKENAKLEGKKYIARRYKNGDTLKELLARSRYPLYKSAEKWTYNQHERMRIVFRKYPDLKKAYSLTHSLRMIFSKRSTRESARINMNKWYRKVEDAGFHSFNIIAATYYEHSEEILNFYNNRSTNASAESFNAKVKNFRAELKGVVDVPFFFFRLTKLYA